MTVNHLQINSESRNWIMLQGSFITENKYVSSVLLQDRVTVFVPT